MDAAACEHASEGRPLTRQLGAGGEPRRARLWVQRMMQPIPLMKPDVTDNETSLHPHTNQPYEEASQF